MLAGAAAVLAVVYLLLANQPARLTFKQGELYYSDPVTQSEATSVGEYLVRQQYFSDEKAVTVRLDRKQGRYQIRFVIDPAYADDPFIAIQYGAMGSEIARDLLGGKPIQVVLSDKELKPIKVLPSSAKLMFGKGELYYTDPITAREARDVGEQLLQIAYFSTDRAASAHLGREQGTYQLRFVIDPSRVDESGILAGFSQVTRAIAVQALGGQPVLMHLCDDRFRTLKSERMDPRPPPSP